MESKEFNPDTLILADEGLFKKNYELLVNVFKRVEAEKIRLIKLENEIMSFIRYFEWLCDCESIGIDKKIFNDVFKK